MDDQGGQTAVEYLGVLLVVVVVIGALAAAARPVGGAIAARIECAASIGSCGGPSPERHAAAPAPGGRFAGRVPAGRGLRFPGLGFSAQPRQPVAPRAPLYGTNEPPPATAAQRRAADQALRDIGTTFFDTVQKDIHGGDGSLVDDIYHLHLQVSAAINRARAAGLTKLADAYQGYLDLQLDRVRQAQFARETPKQQQADIATAINDIANAAAAADGVRDQEGFEQWSKEHQADVDYAVKRWITDSKINANGAELLMRGSATPISGTRSSRCTARARRWATAARWTPC